MWLEPRAQLVRIDHPSFQQNCVLVVGAVGSRVPGTIRWSFPIVEAPDHALARMHQRSPNIDATVALYEAAISFLRADRNVVETARVEGCTVCLPAGPGLLLSLLIGGLDLESKMRLIARANTFVVAEMAEPDQRPVQAAIDSSQSVLAAVNQVR